MKGSQLEPSSAALGPAAVDGRGVSGLCHSGAAC